MGIVGIAPRLTPVVAAFLICVASTAVAARAGLSVAPFHYRAVDLGALVGGGNTTATAINDRGQVVGDSDRGGFIYDGGRVRFLPTGFHPAAINNAGQVAGNLVVGDTVRAALWERGVVRELGTIPGRRDSFATGISDAGQVVGHADSGFEAGDARGFVWTEGHLRDIGSLPGFDGESHAAAINNRGQVVGYLGDPYGTLHAFVWEGGKTRDLGTLPGGTFSYAHDINDRGQVAGRSDAPFTDQPNQNAVIWENGAAADLGGLPGRTETLAFAINETGQVVGSANTYGSDPVAFLGDGHHLWDLNDLLEPRADRPKVTDGRDINDVGQILADRVLLGDDGVFRSHAFLLTPVTDGGGGVPGHAVPLPPAVWTGLATLAGVVVVAARRRS